MRNMKSSFDKMGKKVFEETDFLKNITKWKERAKLFIYLGSIFYLAEEKTKNIVFKIGLFSFHFFVLFLIKKYKNMKIK